MPNLNDIIFSNRGNYPWLIWIPAEIGYFAGVTTMDELGGGGEKEIKNKNMGMSESELKKKNKYANVRIGIEKKNK